ncbi:hypothetical protein L209DRAFT_553787 [Thermothelomyces heterothallicus CBS 203.75]
MPSEGYEFSKPLSRATQSTEYDSEEVLCSVCMYGLGFRSLCFSGYRCIELLNLYEVWFSSTLCLKCNLLVRSPSPEGDVDLHRSSSGAESGGDVIEVNNERVAERMGAS